MSRVSCRSAGPKELVVLKNTLARLPRLQEILQDGASPYLVEQQHFARLFSGQIARVPEADISATGYVVHTLEASLWCLLNTDTFEQAALKAVNFGDDTDTTGTVTGGLAGVCYGLLAIPSRWLDVIARRSELGELFETFTKTLAV
jgi:ADP-ribosylglycohydrolase